MCTAAAAALLALLGAPASAAPTATFGVPTLVGSRNSSLPNGSNFWFPSITIPTGIRGHVAQHITLSGDGGTCPPKPPLSQSCEQTMLSLDGGRSYQVTNKIQAGTSGNFNGYGDLGSWVPPLIRGIKGGEFKTIVGCNDCSDPGGALTEPAFLQVRTPLQLIAPQPPPLYRLQATGLISVAVLRAADVG